jgi:hypothetical protein
MLSLPSRFSANKAPEEWRTPKASQNRRAWELAKRLGLRQSSAAF